VRGRVLRLAAVVLAIALAILVALRERRVFRVVAPTVLIGAIVVVGWLLVGPLLATPRFSTEGPVVRNGVSVIVACGKKQGIAEMGAAMRYAPEPRTGGWWPVRKGACTVWYHRPPDSTQRFNRHERAQEEGYSP
jgi:hypothetical protein